MPDKKIEAEKHRDERIEETGQVSLEELGKHSPYIVETLKDIRIKD